MDVIETLKQDVQEGRIGAERLVDLVAMFQRRHLVMQQQLEVMVLELRTAKQRIEELEKNSAVRRPSSAKLTPCVRKKSGKKLAARRKNAKRNGRRNGVASRPKTRSIRRSEPSRFFPKVSRRATVSSRIRGPGAPGLENGRAVLIAYQIYRGPKKQYGQIPGVLGRSEFGLEIVVEIAFLVYSTGLSLDKACQILNFFQNVYLGKSQANVLLHQLSRHWEGEFETLCMLLANSMVVHTDETSWSLNSVWAFLSEKARLLLFGVHKDAATLKEILDPSTFAGIVISDDAAVYANFTQAQKCWASRRAGIAQGDQADAARSEQRGVPKLYGSTVEDLSRSVSRAA